MRKFSPASEFQEIGLFHKNIGGLILSKLDAQVVEPAQHGRRGNVPPSKATNPERTCAVGKRVGS
jgi:hypothetical protein